ncbi:MAG: lytic transglycosylase domain-containing protein [Lentisphaeria bacterium]|nr:lytic transglycosylase domain-containing protein [Lentisphaeria bacterium]NQZ68522.1 lytic transglycosylase domain-containing protein [Lentisphaeria bacterium]
MRRFNKKHIKYVIVFIVCISALGLIAGLLPLNQRYERLAQITPIINTVAQKESMNPSLIIAVIRQESDFKADSVGDAGEIGLMQLTMGAVQDWSRITKNPMPEKSELFQIELNIQIGSWYLNRAMSQFKHLSKERQVILALSQYNAGRSRALRWDKNYKKNLLERIPISSTRNYISSVVKYKSHYSQKVN